MSKLEARKEREKAWLALLLAGVAGAVDAVGYLLLLHLFTAHMSGNSVAMGLSIGQTQWQTALLRAIPIPLFVFGVALGTAVIEIAIRQRIRSQRSFRWFVASTVRRARDVLPPRRFGTSHIHC